MPGVAQAVVDKIVLIHHDVNMSNSNATNGKRDDITLLVRNFNFPIPNAIKSPTSAYNPLLLTSRGTDDYNMTIEEPGTSTTSTETDSARAAENRNVRMKPYVDFSEFYANYEKRKNDGTLPKSFQS